MELTCSGAAKVVTKAGILQHGLRKTYGGYRQTSTHCNREQMNRPIFLMNYRKSGMHLLIKQTMKHYLGSRQSKGHTKKQFGHPVCALGENVDAWRQVWMH